MLPEAAGRAHGQPHFNVDSRCSFAGENPLQCDRRLCWIRRGEEEGWLSWIRLEGRPKHPRCSGDNTLWANVSLDCPHQGKSKKRVRMEGGMHRT